MSTEPISTTLIAFDYGLARTGVAIANTITRSASPLEIIQARSHHARFLRIETLLNEWQVSIAVVGLPFYPDGQAHQMTQNCQRFAQRLQGRYPHLLVVTEDERYTSALASDDASAAALILQQYLDRSVPTT